MHCILFDRHYVSYVSIPNDRLSAVVPVVVRGRDVVNFS